ncbi:MAG TPA: serine/threonine-protein kinase, partial [Candidatus Obscuribacterales bacterium]
MLESGQILQGRYQLQEKLGQNAGRQTWLATDIQTSPAQSAIVKLLAFSPQMQWEELKLFEREAEVLKNLNHPRIPRYRDSFSIDKQAGAGLYWFGLVQDYIPGSSLRQMLDRGRCFSEAQVRSFATGILEILIYLHELSPALLHRDIKPSNLILGEDEQIYLVDFGAVQNRAVVEGATFTVVGTTGYTPLEQFWGRAVPASDLYALGATIIHLLTGTAPADLPQRNLRIQFNDRVSISPSFGRWIDAIAHPDIDQRFSTAREALAALSTGRSLTASIPIISQPHDSRVEITKSPSQLKIKIPGSRKSFINNIALAIAFIKKLKNVKSNFNLPILDPFGDYCIYLDKDKFAIERQLV